MSDADRVVILGGHGKIALMAAPKLKEAGYSVDSVIRNPDQTAEVEAAEVDATDDTAAADEASVEDAAAESDEAK